MRFYYKDNKGNYFNFKSEHSDYIEITEDEFNAATKPKEPTGEQKAAKEKQARIVELHRLLEGLDYIGVKIATGRATREEYAEEIALMDEYASELNELEGEKKHL